MDIGTFRGVITAILLIAFVGLVIWAYSGRRRQSFDEAARLPFDDEPTAQPRPEDHQDKGDKAL
uniref:cbb3-type cytochrome oxidase subunit 3 n=1 Tax=Halomonas sp. TaxID=1486246 RepID=UPI002623E533|nr:cbb3-type cytochrome c oxidase subunit 3 [Halomonas sp.]